MVSELQKSLEAQLEPYAAYLAGTLLTSILLVKGQAGPAEPMGMPFSGADAQALEKALVALGWPINAWCGVLCAPGVSGRRGTAANERASEGASTVTSEGAPLALSPNDLRLICEIVDPLVVVALDEQARRLLIDAFIQAESGFLADFTPGAQTMVLGRRFVSVDGFEAALDNADTKQRVWAQLKHAAWSTPVNV
ncbi:MAG: hypothetical protein LBI64_04575 [Coriobacteriales bacterium]|nr:hypothetical protein [Coriobacteriales bacterium]